MITSGPTKRFVSDSLHHCSFALQGVLQQLYSILQRSRRQVDEHLQDALHWIPAAPFGCR